MFRLFSILWGEVNKTFKSLFMIENLVESMLKIDIFEFTINEIISHKLIQELNLLYQFKRFKLWLLHWITFTFFKMRNFCYYYIFVARLMKSSLESNDMFSTLQVENCNNGFIIICGEKFSDYKIVYLFNWSWTNFLAKFMSMAFVALQTNSKLLRSPRQIH